jgi:hypothetical protein
MWEFLTWGTTSIIGQGLALAFSFVLFSILFIIILAVSIEFFKWLKRV